jgi:hypothetical protein
VGTSTSNGGPKDKIPLLPEWALPPPEEGEPPIGEEESPDEPTDQEEDNDEGDDQGEDGDGGVDTDNEVENDADTDADQQAPELEQSSWRSARTLLGKVPKSGDRRTAFRKAARSYVSARGGSRGATQTSPSGRNATARIGRFFADVARRGLNAALESINLGSVVGKDATTVFAAISNALSPSGDSPEQAAAREAVNDVLADVYEQFVGDDGDLARLNALTGEDVARFVVESASAYIYRRWLQDLGKQIEKKTISPAQAVGLEREARLFVKDAVSFDFRSVDPLSVDWRSDGGSIVEKIYNQAYSLFGEGR